MTGVGKIVEAYMKPVYSGKLLGETADKEGFAARLKMARGKIGITQQVLANKIGVSLTTIQNYEAGQIPKGGNAADLSEALGCSTDWLLKGNGDVKEKTSAKTEHDGLLDETGAEMLFVPLVDARLSAGHGSLETSADIQRQYAFRASFLRRRGNPAHMVLMRVTGDSMTPEIKNRDVVLIDQSQKDLRPGYIYAVGVEDMVYLKVVDAKPGQVILSSYNKEYEPLVIDTHGDQESGIRIIGRALWACRDLS
jgi:phage repressor protein C with HTH and peptisase S24 domain